MWAEALRSRSHEGPQMTLWEQWEATEGLDQGVRNLIWSGSCSQKDRAQELRPQPIPVLGPMEPHFP
jgi:hypothetical protein